MTKYKKFLLVVAIIFNFISLYNYKYFDKWALYFSITICFYFISKALPDNKN